MTTNNVFSLIKGGLSENSEDSRKEFVSATVTDTRLMGVVGMSITWNLPENDIYTNFHQFFYFDAEETGFDTYKSVLGCGDEKEAEDVKEAELSMIGGLGGQKVSVTEDEARYLLQKYVQFNYGTNQSLPSGYHEYEFLLTPAVNFSEDELRELMRKQCVKIENEYQTINYFLMRCYGKDFEAAKYLTKGYVRTNLFPEHKAGTLLKNTIEEAPDALSGSNSSYYSTGDGNFNTFQTFKSYMCESLVEYDGKYFLFVTQVSLDKFKVVKYEKHSTFRVSHQEAMMMITRGEFVTVVDIVEDGPLFTKDTTEFTSRAMVQDYESGRLYMVYHPHNDHVKNQVYRLNDDVLGVYFVVDDSQIVLSSFELSGIRALEQDLASSPMSKFVEVVSKYQFQESIIFDFINSCYDDFEDFVAVIAHPTEE